MVDLNPRDERRSACILKASRARSRAPTCPVAHSVALWLWFGCCGTKWHWVNNFPFPKLLLCLQDDGRLLLGR